MRERRVGRRAHGRGRQAPSGEVPVPAGASFAGGGKFTDKAEKRRCVQARASRAAASSRTRPPSTPWEAPEPAGRELHVVREVPGRGRQAPRGEAPEPAERGRRAVRQARTRPSSTSRRRARACRRELRGLRRALGRGGEVPERVEVSSGAAASARTTFKNFAGKCYNLRRELRAVREAHGEADERLAEEWRSLQA